MATTAVAVLAFSAVLDRARAAYAWFDALVAPEDERTVSVDDVLRTVCGVLALWLVPFSSICWHLLKWLAPTGRLMLYELVQIVLFGVVPGCGCEIQRGRGSGSYSNYSRFRGRLSEYMYSCMIQVFRS